MQVVFIYMFNSMESIHCGHAKCGLYKQVLFRVGFTVYICYLPLVQD